MARTTLIIINKKQKQIIHSIQIKTNEKEILIKTQSSL